MTTRPRIRLASPIKPGEPFEVRTLISHVMETGQRRGADGQLVARSIIHSFTASFAGKDIFRAELQPGISANPYLAFYMRAAAPGELTLTWLDDAGEAIVEKVPIAFG